MKRMLLIVLIIVFTASSLFAVDVITDWTAVTQNAAWGNRDNMSSVTFTPKTGPYANNAAMWVVSGWTSPIDPKDTWRSLNGADWIATTKNAAFLGREKGTLLSYNNKMYLIGGQYYDTTIAKDVWWSDNGVDWYSATGNAAFGAVLPSTGCVYNNKMWLIVGNKGVYNSINGSDWAATTLNAEFPPGAWGSRAVVSFLNKLTLVDYYHQLVWTSTDGISWTLIKNPTEFSSRSGAGVTVWNGYLWVLGGQLSGTDLKDTWRSADGITWTQDSDATWTARMQSQPFSFNNKLLIAGGIYSNNVNPADVWMANLNATTPTITPTWSKTPTVTRTITQTITPTRTPAVTKTVTRTTTPYPTATITVTITQTVTPVPTVTVTQTITPIAPNPVILKLVSSDACGFRDAIKLQWSGYPLVYDSLDVTLYVNDLIINLGTQDNVSQSKSIFSYILKNLAYNEPYSIYVEIASDEWDTITSNIITVELVATVTSTP